MPLPKEIEEQLTPREKELLNKYTTDVEDTYFYGLHVFLGICAPKLDLSFFNTDKKGANQKRLQLINSLEEAAKTDIDIPEGLSEQDVSTIMLAILSKKEYMAKTYKDSLGGAGSTLPSDFDFHDGGLATFVENFSTKDERLNMNFIINAVPDARKEAVRVINDFKNGNTEQVFNILKDSLSSYLGIAKQYNDASDKYTLFDTQIISRIYAALNNPRIKSAGFISKDDIHFVDIYQKRTEFVQKSEKLKLKALELCLTKKYQNPNVDFSKEKDVMDMVAEHLASKAYIGQLSKYSTALYNAYGQNKGTGKDPNKQMAEREPFIIEEFLLNDNNANAYLDQLKEDVLTTLENETVNKNIKFETIQSWLDAPNMTIFSNLTSGTVLIHEYDSLSTVKQVENMLQFAVDSMKKTKNGPNIKEIERIRKTALLKNPPLPKDPTKEQLEQRIKDCDEYLDVVNDNNVDHNIDGYVMSIQNELKHAAEHLKEAIANFTIEQERINKAIKQNKEKIHDEAMAFYAENNNKQQEVDNLEKFNEANAIIANESKEPVLAENETIFGTPTVDAAKRLLTAETNRLLTLMKDEPGFKDTLDLLVRMNASLETKLSDNEFKKISEKITAALSEKQDALTEEMLDNDSPRIQQEISSLGRVMEQIELLGDARKINPKYANPNSDLAIAYKGLEQMSNGLQDKIDQMLQAKDVRYRLASEAAISIETLKNAIKNEAMGNKKQGLSSVAPSDIMCISLFQLEEQNPGEPSKFIPHNVREYANSLAADKQIKKNLSSFNSKTLSKMTLHPEDFAKLVQVNNKDKKATLESMETNVRKERALRAKKIINRYNKQTALFSNYIKSGITTRDNINPFDRLAMSLLDISGTSQAEEKNINILKTLETPEGKAEYLKKGLKSIFDLDIKKMLSTDVDEILDYSEKNWDTLCFAFDPTFIQNRNIADPEVKQLYKSCAGVLQEAGVMQDIVESLATEEYVKGTFDNMSAKEINDYTMQHSDKYLVKPDKSNDGLRHRGESPYILGFILLADRKKYVDIVPKLRDAGFKGDTVKDFANTKFSDLNGFEKQPGSVIDGLAEGEKYQAQTKPKADMDKLDNLLEFPARDKSLYQKEQPQVQGMNKGI